MCKYAIRLANCCWVIFCWKPGILARPSMMISETRSSFTGMPLVMYFFLIQPMHAGTAQVTGAVGIVTLGAARVVHAPSQRLFGSEAQFGIRLAGLAVCAGDDGGSNRRIAVIDVRMSPRIPHRWKSTQPFRKCVRVCGARADLRA